MNSIADPTPFYKRLCYNLLSISLIILLLYTGQEILVPLFFAILLASLLLPIVSFLEKKRFHRIFAILISLAISLIIISTVVYFLANQMADFFDDLPTFNSRLDKLTSIIHKWVRSNLHITIRLQNQYIDETFQNMKSSGNGLLGETFITITQVLSYVVLLPVYTFLLLYYRHLVKKFLIEVFNSSRHGEVRDILYESQAISQSYVLGLLIEMAIVFGLNATGFLILGIKYAVFLALVAALLNLIPYIGMLVANLFCMLITLVSSEVMDLSDVIWVGIVLALVQFIDNNFLMPLIVGAKVRINSLVTIVGVLVGGALCGYPGMFLSIPGLAILKVIFDRVDGLKPFGMLIGDESPVRAGQAVPDKII